MSKVDCLGLSRSDEGYLFKGDDMMKIYMSVDIEGVTGVTDWDETDKTKPDYLEFREQMTAEASAACRGAMAAGAGEILIKDAHGTARNLIPSNLPVEARLIRGWSGHPFSMMDGLDSSFHAAMMIGYHASAGSDTNPLAHTITSGLSYIKINGQYASEFLLNVYTAAYQSVPVIFLSGDLGICNTAKEIVPGITTVPVKECSGNLTVNIHPDRAIERIQNGAESALNENIEDCRIRIPGALTVEVRYHLHAKARLACNFPGVQLVDPYTVSFNTGDYYEVLRTLSFILKV